MKTSTKEFAQAEVKYLERSLCDDGSYCRLCGSNAQGWCKEKSCWCYKAKKQCEQNKAYQSANKKTQKKKKV